MKILVALAILSGLTAFIAWLQIINRRETKRRAALSPDERAKAERDDAIWSQEFGF